MIDRQKFHDDMLTLFFEIKIRTREILLPIDQENSLQVFLATQLDFYSQRCIATFHLLRSGLFWDAEMIFRSASESAIKILFVCISDEPERANRVEEFSERLNELESFRFRARASAGKTGNVRTEVMFSMLAMASDEREEHNSRWTKQERKALEKKWAFAEIVKELDRKAVEEEKEPYVRTLVHSYGVASHFLHADQMAIDLSIDRELRSAETREILEHLHFAEMLSRSVAVLVSLTSNVAAALNKKLSLVDCVENLLPFLEQVEALRETLYEAERDLYAAADA